MQQVRTLLPDAIAWYKHALKRMDEVSVRLYAAAIAYRTVFSLIAFASTLGVIAILLDVQPGTLRDGAGIENASTVGDSLEQIGYQRAAQTMELGPSTAWIAGIVGFLVGLYTLAGGFAALCEVLDRVHGIHVYRTMTWRYLRGAGVAIIFLVFALISAVALVATTSVGETVFGGLGLDKLSSLWHFIFVFVIPAVSVVLTFGFVLRWGSHARPPWGEVIPGAIVGSGSWFLLFLGFIAYIQFFNGFEGYGALASSIALLLFGYLQAYIVILAALFRHEIATVIALIPFVRRKGEGGAVELHLPRMGDG